MLQLFKHHIHLDNKMVCSKHRNPVIYGGLDWKGTRTKVLLRNIFADGKVETIGRNRDRKYRLPEKFYGFSIFLRFV